MGSWHTSVSPCHCDNPLNCGLMFFKRKIFNHILIKRVITENGIRANGTKLFRELATIATIIS
jgi:hypothetical protein